MERIEIPLKPWTGRGRATTGALRTRALWNVLVGAILLLFGGLGLVAIWFGRAEFWVGGPLLLFVGGVLLWSGLRLRRATRSLASGEPVALAAPYAFALEGDEVFFPAGLTWAEERWPLNEAVFSVGRRFGQQVLIVRCAGRRLRRFPALGLAREPVEVLNTVRQYRERR